MTWKVVLTKQANKDAKKLAAAGLQPQEYRIIDNSGRKFLPILSIL